MPRYERVEADGFTFLFAYDTTDPELLHIYARHLTTIDDALDVWFDDATEDVWDEKYERFETVGQHHVLYWTWVDPQRRVLIISCFRREEDDE